MSNSKKSKFKVEDKVSFVGGTGEILEVKPAESSFEYRLVVETGSLYGAELVITEKGLEAA